MRLESKLTLTLDLTNEYPTIEEVQAVLDRAAQVELSVNTVVRTDVSYLTITEGDEE